MINKVQILRDLSYPPILTFEFPPPLKNTRTRVKVGLNLAKLVEFGQKWG